MMRSIQLVLSKIRYDGNSIGDDIRVEVEILGKFLRVDRRIKPDTTANINIEIGKFATDRNVFEANIGIHIIEKDIVFNDVGSVQGKIKTDITVTKPQRFVYAVRIKETRSASGASRKKATALFEITLEARVLDAIRYVPDERDGWLKIIMEGDTSKKFLSAYLKVKLERIQNKREYFTILEGPYRGKTASVKLREDGSSHLIPNVQHEPMVRAIYSISRKTFILNGKAYKTVDYPEAPWSKGVYDIEIPDYAHEGGRYYLEQSKRAMTWFRIGHSGERYLHTGGRSLGCITIVETKRWIEIYNASIKARKGDFMSVGVLTVVD